MFTVRDGRSILILHFLGLAIIIAEVMSAGVVPYDEVDEIDELRDILEEGVRPTLPSALTGIKTSLI